MDLLSRLENTFGTDQKGQINGGKINMFTKFLKDYGFMHQFIQRK